MRAKAKKLWEQSKEYHLMDTRWKVNYRTRLRRLAKQLDPMDGTCDAASVMYLDHASLRTGIIIQ